MNRTFSDPIRNKIQINVSRLQIDRERKKNSSAMY